jgi:murein L,D-transpeptidase YcbB/YkuD
MSLTSPRFSGNQRLQRAATNQPPMRRGERGDAVALLQDALVELGFPMPITTQKGESFPDGIFGAETEKTVAEFQSRHGLTRDGVAGHDTLHRLDELFQYERTYLPRRCHTYRDGWGSSTSRTRTGC